MEWSAARRRFPRRRVKSSGQRSKGSDREPCCVRGSASTRDALDIAERCQPSIPGSEAGSVVGAATTLPLIAAAADTENSPSPSGPHASLGHRGRQVKGVTPLRAHRTASGRFGASTGRRDWSWWRLSRRWPWSLTDDRCRLAPEGSEIEHLAVPPRENARRVPLPERAGLSGRCCSEARSPRSLRGCSEPPGLSERLQGSVGDLGRVTSLLAGWSVARGNQRCGRASRQLASALRPPLRSACGAGGPANYSGCRAFEGSIRGTTRGPRCGPRVVPPVRCSVTPPARLP